jgi:DNA polymerase elongation subunit (family B)
MNSKQKALTGASIAATVVIEADYSGSLLPKEKVEELVRGLDDDNDYCRVALPAHLRPLKPVINFTPFTGNDKAKMNLDEHGQQTTRPEEVEDDEMNEASKDTAATAVDLGPRLLIAQKIKVAPSVREQQMQQLQQQFGGPSIPSISSTADEPIIQERPAAFLDTSAMDTTSSSQTLKLNFEKLMSKNNVEEDSCLFYWIDAFEDPFRNPGQLILFGKVMTNEKAVTDALRHNAFVKKLEEKRTSKAKAASEAALASVTSSSSAATVVPPNAEDDKDEIMTDDAPLPAKKLVPQPLFNSCALTISGNLRCCFVLPRTFSTSGEEVSLQDIYAELKDGPMRSIIPPSKGSFAVKKATRKYAFEQMGVPREETDYLKLVYSAHFPVLPADITGKTFFRIFGTSTTCIENFLLKRKLKGPCWLRLSGGKLRNNETPISHCAYDLAIDNPKCVTVYGSVKNTKKNPAPSMPAKPLERVNFAEFKLQIPIPDLTVLSMSLKTVLNPKTHLHEIVTASICVHKHVRQDNPSNEAKTAVQTLTIIRPVAGSAGLPADFRQALQHQPNVLPMPDERTLLNQLITQLTKIDPDVLCGHNILGFDLDIFLHRLAYYKISNWSRVGRLRRTAMPRVAQGVGGRDQFTGQLTPGRLVCDTYLAAKELIRETSYALTPLAASQLNEKRDDIEPVDVPRMLEVGPGCMKLATQTENDAWLAMRLMFKLQVIPLTKQLTNLSGNLWARSLRGARAERIEFLLLHEFHSLKFIVPDKERFGDNRKIEADDDEDADDDDDGPSAAGGKRSTKGKRTVTGTGVAARAAKGKSKPDYAGGLVLEPKKGLYDKFVLILDFQSLYPSIIQEYNICFTTVDRQLKRSKMDFWTSRLQKGKRKLEGKGRTAKADGAAIIKEGAEGDNGFMDTEAAVFEAATAAVPDDDEDDEDEEFIVPKIPDKAKYGEQGPLPRVIANLVKERRDVKKLMNAERDPVKKEQLNVRQLAIKILANSMYGCLGFSHSRFYAKGIAALVTSQGREILTNTVEIAREQMGLDVIYGDTDSIMINTNLDDLKAVKEKGNELKKKINNLYQKLEIEIDGIFSMMLLLKKKKYAAMKVIEDRPSDDKSFSVKREVKGLDMVRRDWCQESRALSDQVLNIIFNSKDKDEVGNEILKLLESVQKKARNNEVPVDQWVITRGLNKAPKDYPDAKNQPHLQVAIAMLQQGKTVNVGDHVPYVICVENSGTLDIGKAPPATPASGAPSVTSTVVATPNVTSPGVATSPQTTSPANTLPQGTSPSTAAVAHPKPSSSASAASRAFHPDDFRRAAGELHIDINWYLVQQIFPPILRICEGITEISRDQLANALGIVGHYSSLNKSGNDYNRDDDMGYTPKTQVADDERFKDVEKLMVKCLKCSHIAEFPGVYGRTPLPPGTNALEQNSAPLRSGLHCSKFGCDGLWGLRDLTLTADTTKYDFSQKKLTEACIVQLQNAVTLTMRRHLARLQAGWLVCEDGMCGAKTQCISSRKAGFACPSCPSGLLKLEYDAGDFHEQMSYFSSLFDEKRQKAKRENENPPSISSIHRDIYDAVFNQVTKVMKNCAYNYVEPEHIFGYITKMNTKRNISVLPIAGFSQPLQPAKKALNLELLYKPIKSQQTDRVGKSQASDGLINLEVVV